ncbi:MAG: PAS domain-containing sensor histidine kinase [Planctomycetes bacterium]|nr:PAS domain-containing sensor histidine kinase [Planctomycetota bacterium]
MNDDPVQMNPDSEESAESRLPSSDRMFRLLFEEAPYYCCVLDEELVIVAANRRCRESFTTPFSRRCYQVFKGRKETCSDCPAVTTLKENRVSESVETVIDRSGRAMDVSCRTIPLPDKSGRIASVMHMSYRAGPAEKLQQAMTSMDSQLGAVSHGIKGLLTAMAGGFYMWDSGLQGNKADRMGKGIDVVRRSFQRLQHMAHDVMYYVRDRRMHMEPLDGAEVLKRVAEEIREDWGFVKAEILLAEKPAGGVPMHADRRALESSLRNLIVSSLDDCRVDKRDIKHRVRLSVKNGEGYAQFEIDDNGIGMDQDTLEKVFSLFFNPKGIESAGVGLYITNKLARLHQGKVEIESERNKGTQYRLSLPLKPSGTNG